MIFSYSSVKRFCFLLVLCFSLTSDVDSRSKTGAGSGDFKRKSVKIRKPRGYKLPSAKSRSFKNGEVIVKMFARNFTQGNALYFEIFGNPKNIKSNVVVRSFYYNKKKILLSKKRWGYRGLIGIHPGSKPGKKQIKVVYSVGGDSRKFVFKVMISRSGFKFYKRPLDLGKYSDVDYQQRPEVLALIRRCTVKKKKVFSEKNKDLLGMYLSHPRNMHYITSPFWAKRLVMRYKKRKGKKKRLKNKVNIHRGLDFRGKIGTPIYSIANGRVVLAEPMYYEGNFLIIDHGNRIFSYFMHLHKFKVKKGDVVRGGDLVGLVGSTGIATGSHLHLSLMIQGVQVDPLSLLPLPFRE